MQIRKAWDSNLYLVLLIWLTVTAIIRPGWIYFFLGILAWFVLVFLTAPGIFWTYAALLTPNPTLTEWLLKKALTFKPLVSYPYLILGLSYARRQKWFEAIPLLEEAVALTPQPKKNHNLNWLGEAYRASGLNEKALPIFEELLKKGPSSMKLYLNLALVHLQLNHLPEALDYANKARVNDQSATEPVLIQAKIYFTMGEYQKAKTDYQWVIEHLKWPVESLYWLGRAEFELGEIDAAIAHLQTAVERITKDPLLADVGKDEAAEWLNRILEAHKSK